MICDFVLKKCHYQSGLVRDHHNGTLFVFFTSVVFITPWFSLDVLERYHCIDWNCLFQYLCDKLQVDGEVDVI